MRGGYEVLNAIMCRNLEGDLQVVTSLQICQGHR